MLSFLLAVAVCAPVPAQQADSRVSENEKEVIGEIFDIGTVNSILIEKNRELIVERYEGRMSANRATNIKSASKSVLSLLIGKSILKALIKLSESFFPIILRHIQNRKKKISPSRIFLPCVPVWKQPAFVITGDG